MLMGRVGRAILSKTTVSTPLRAGLRRQVHDSVAVSTVPSADGLLRSPVNNGSFCTPSPRCGMQIRIRPAEFGPAADWVVAPPHRGRAPAVGCSVCVLRSWAKRRVTPRRYITVTDTIPHLGMAKQSSRKRVSDRRSSPESALK
jgi:hypothetical protein